MQKLESSLKNMVVVLVGVALIVGAILAYVNHITSGPIAEKAEKSLAAGIKSVMGTEELQVAEPEEVEQTIDGKQVKFTIHKCSDKSGKELGAAVESVTGGFGGDLKVLVGFDSEGNILGYTILQTSETPGLGAKAATWFQKDGKGCVIGKNPKEGDLHVSKDDKSGNAVDAITASTITSRAFLKAINQAYAAYTHKGVDGESGATKVKKG
nr:RnfABCDGE type electron transport complex subunit G [uncultured Prevotella sp.]